MYDPISVDTALVSSTGDLLISLTDGNIVNAGKVRGAQGIQGERGFIGERGEPGRDGVDGAQWHTGVGMPELGLGVSGDLYMDVANSLLPIYQKVGNDWLLLCNLKVTPSGGGGGGGSAAGGGGAIIIYPMPDGGTPPTNDNNGKPIDKGDIWFDPNTGWLWVYDGTNWLPVGDRPPVSVQPTPPLWNPAGDTNNRYPIVEGDLWFDSEQLALYVAANNSNDDLVWIIALPVNRDGLEDVVGSVFVMPVAVDGETAYNPLTKTWYIYNASKNQWIDLPKNCQTADYTYMGDTSGTVLGPGEFMLLSTDPSTGTEIAIRGDLRPFIEVKSFLNINGTEYEVIAVNYVESDNATHVFVEPEVTPPFVVGESYTFSSCGITTQKEEVYYGASQPDIVADSVEEGDLWVDSNDNKMYVWNGSAWSEVTACTGVGNDGEFVKKQGGDSMEGPLTITGGRSDTGDGLESTVKTLNVDSGENSSLQLKWNKQVRVYVGDEQTTLVNDLKFNTGGKAIYAGGTDKKGFVINDGGVFYDGAYTNDRHVATKAKLDVLSNQIIELEEEIDALAPAVERGSWEFNLSGTISGPGKFTAYDQYVATSGNATGLVTNIKSLWFHSIDNAATPHGFDNVEEGNMLELFVEGSEEYGLFTVVDVHDYTASGDYWVIDVDFVRTLEQTTRFDNGEVCRLKIFEPPSGGTADDFIKSGGTTELTSWVRIKPPAGEDYNFGISGGPATSSTGTIFFIQDGSGTPNSVFRVQNDGKVQAGNSASSAFIATANNDLTTKKYVDDANKKAIQVAGLQLGRFKYRTSGDSYNEGCIKSNTTLTTPGSINMIELWYRNLDLTEFGLDFYEQIIAPNMYFRFTDHNVWNYTGKITAVERTTSTAAIKLTMVCDQSLSDGNVVRNMEYDVSIGYNKLA